MASSLFNNNQQLPSTGQPGNLTLNPEMIKQLDGFMNLINSSSTKEAAIQMFMQNNPNAQQYMSLLNGNYKEAAIKMAQSHGLNANQVEQLIMQYLNTKR